MAGKCSCSLALLLLHSELLGKTLIREQAINAKLASYQFRCKVSLNLRTYMSHFCLRHTHDYNARHN
jgi:hypothetical protein